MRATLNRRARRDRQVMLCACTAALVFCLALSGMVALIVAELTP